MTQQTIEVEGLPEGWKAVAIKLEELEGSDSEHAIYIAKVIAEKIQPRRIVLEETEEVASINEFQAAGDDKGYPKILFKSDKIWREVKE